VAPGGGLRQDDDAVRIDREQVGAVTILSFVGEFDAVSKPAMLQEIDDLIEGSKQVVFNLSEVTFVNSSALGYLLKTVKTLRDEGGELVFTEPAKCFRNIVDVYGIDKVFLVFASDRAALEHFGEAGDTVP
jgi:anti-sigma B factor antagonist